MIKKQENFIIFGGSQASLPVGLLCYDLLDFFCSRGDGRFVLKEVKI